jgi:hypothetical protein
MVVGQTGHIPHPRRDKLRNSFFAGFSPLLAATSAPPAAAIATPQPGILCMLVSLHGH